MIKKLLLFPSSTKCRELSVSLSLPAISQFCVITVSILLELWSCNHCHLYRLDASIFTCIRKMENVCRACILLIFTFPQVLLVIRAYVMGLHPGCSGGRKSEFWILYQKGEIYNQGIILNIEGLYTTLWQPWKWQSLLLIYILKLEK